MKRLLRMFLMFFGQAIAAALASVLALVPVIHFLSGSSSPGLLGVAKQGMQYWIPMWIGMTILWAVWTFARIIVLSRREANATGLRWLTYLELPRAEKRRLLGLAGDEE